MVSGISSVLTLICEYDIYLWPIAINLAEIPEALVRKQKERRE